MSNLTKNDAVQFAHARGDGDVWYDETVSLVAVQVSRMTSNMDRIE